MGGKLLGIDRTAAVGHREIQRTFLIAVLDCVYRILGGDGIAEQNSQYMEAKQMKPATVDVYEFCRHGDPP